MTRQSTTRRGSGRTKTARTSVSVRTKKSKKTLKSMISVNSAELTANDGKGNKPLRDCTEQALRGYFSTINGHDVADLYDFVLGEVEVPLLRTVLEHTGGNQTRAAEMLGINRGTLRKKLRQYRLDL
jgi:Fis family transcriptional regulator, factor for inversion stimulation protein